jgi:hypothetical protein
MLKVESFKDFQKLLKLCRDQGVKTIQLGEMKIELDLQVTTNNRPLTKRQLKEIDLDLSLTNISAGTPIPHPEIPNDLPDAETLLFWSAGEESQSEQQ